MKGKKDFIQKIDAHQGLINKVVFLYADNTEDKRDLKQEIIAQAWGSFKSFRGDSKFSTWLYRVALNVAIAGIRKQKRKNSYEHTENQYVVPPHSNEKELLETIIKVLNPIEKNMVLLMIEGYNNSEIADIIGISEGNVRVKIHRIRNKLKEYGIK